MKKFRFTLQAALDLRRHEEEQAVQALGAQLAAQRGLQAQRDSLEAELQQARLAPLPPHLGGQRDLFVQRLHLRRMRVENSLREQAILVAEARQQVVRAQAAHGAVQRLRERQQAQWRSELQREEDRELAEVAARRQR